MIGIKIRQATRLGYIECEEGGCFDASYPMSENRRGRVQGRGGCLSPTITTAGTENLIHIEKIMETTKTKRPEGRGWCWDEDSKRWFRVRKLTPREAGRLMDVSESDIDKMMQKDENGKQVISNSQLYKMYGNSIVVSCLYHIFKNLFTKDEDIEYQENEQLTLF